ncbi:MAG: DNA-deoxyinosine glycosylase [Victivallaceae bacterium]|nr:DNA-deoxyinosine glycosylase [Victivallaceae bacterium]
MSEIFSFDAFARPDATRLILGSMPGVASLRRRQYYAHPHNCFWRIMGELLEFDYRRAYAERIEYLLEHRIALWDTAERCIRPGSMDSDIKQVQPNDFEALFRKCPGIGKIFFNGQTAHRLFLKHCRQMRLPETELIVLPSTSPANASIPYSKKLEVWRQIKERVDSSRNPAYLLY